MSTKQIRSTDQIKSLADLLGYHRKRLGLNQTEAARKVGRTQQVWSRWEAGIMLPPLHVLPDVAKLIGEDLGRVTELAAKSSVKVKARGPVPSRKSRLEQLEVAIVERDQKVEELQKQVEQLMKQKKEGEDED